MNPHHSEVDWDAPGLDFSQYSSTGVIGDPTEASVELGGKIWSAIVEEVTTILKDIAEMSR